MPPRSRPPRVDSDHGVKDAGYVNANPRRRAVEYVLTALLWGVFAPLLLDGHRLELTWHYARRAGQAAIIFGVVFAVGSRACSADGQWQRSGATSAWSDMSVTVEPQSTMHQCRLWRVAIASAAFGSFFEIQQSWTAPRTRTIVGGCPTG